MNPPSNILSSNRPIQCVGEKGSGLKGLWNVCVCLHLESLDADRKIFCVSWLRENSCTGRQLSVACSRLQWNSQHHSDTVEGVADQLTFMSLDLIFPVIGNL